MSQTFINMRVRIELLCDEINEDMRQKVVRNMTTRLEEVVRCNAGLTKHVIQ